MAIEIGERDERRREVGERRQEQLHATVSAVADGDGRMLADTPWPMSRWRTPGAAFRRVPDVAATMTGMPQPFRSASRRAIRRDAAGEPPS